MADPQNWQELKAAVADWADRDDADVDAIAAEAIALAERRLQRDLFSPERETTIVLATAGEAVALPPDLWAIRSAFLATDPKTVLEPMTSAALRNAHAAAATGKPRHYAVEGEALVLGPAPDAEYPLVLTYVQTIPALGEAQPSNWLLARHSDVYLHGALTELCAKMRDTEGATIHEARLQAAIESVNRSAVRRTQGSAPIRLRAAQVV